METFTVEAVIDGNTFEVSPKWEFDNEKGDLVQAKGYTAPKTGKGAMAVEQRLSGLIQNKKVELGAPDGVRDNKLVCEVYYRGVNIADYFSAYREEAKTEEEAGQEETSGINDDEGRRLETVLLWIEAFLSDLLNVVTTEIRLTFSHSSFW